MTSVKPSSPLLEGFRSCNGCNWVGFPVSREFALGEVIKFNNYFSTLSPEQQETYYRGKGATIGDYEFCRRCGTSHTNFRVTTPEEVPFGSTVNPIIFEGEL